MSSFRKEDSEGMLVSIKLQVLSYEFIDHEIFVG